MSFADKVEIEIKAGKGGDGRLSFRHEKFRAKGGPDGGDGGRGGSVILQADHNLDTLSKYKTNRRVTAPDGQPGGSNRKRGRSGEDTVILVPPGTIAKDGEQILADLTTTGQQAVIARGGRGGFGNAHFTASARQAPRVAELGEPGEQLKLTLELKLVADVGLVGLPNAGKSTLLSVISNARPEIGDYPFTTLVPNLGIVDFAATTFMVADIPGLIAGASAGKGLGDEFLRHIERTSVVLHLIDAHSPQPAVDFRTIMKELKTYSVDLTAKPQLVVLTKTEGLSSPALAASLKSLQQAASYPVYAISAVAHQGLDALLRDTVSLVKAARAQRAAQEAEQLPVISLESDPGLWQVAKDDGGWRVKGERVESFARRTDWANPHAVERLRDILRKLGVAKELQKQGIEPGQPVQIGTHELEWLE
jgi:GTPase